MSERHIGGTQYVPIIVTLSLGVPSPEEESRDLGNWESGVESGSTLNLLHDLKLVPCPLWNSDTYLGHEVDI